MRIVVLISAALVVAGCSQSAETNATNVAASNASALAKKHAYCFFKDDEMKGWTASREPDGNIRINGKAHVKDPRYKAVIAQWAVGPKKVIVSPSITTNDTGYAKPDDWWDVTAAVPKTASLNAAEVQCGDKVVADLQVAPNG